MKKDSRCLVFLFMLLTSLASAKSLNMLGSGFVNPPDSIQIFSILQLTAFSVNATASSKIWLLASRYFS